ncbi:hypothetical protein D922_04439 [Enterococcus faecalis 06-MB-DW-09]|nr:hypothetical protein D922_04439 [Enterococcus faecalis 06-MB-DW-09]
MSNDIVKGKRKGLMSKLNLKGKDRKKRIIGKLLFFANEFRQQYYGDKGITIKKVHD